MVTSLYGLAVLSRPSTLTGPADLPDTRANRAFARALGLRDAASGVALVATAAQPARARWAVTARVLADVTDVVVFGIVCPPHTRAKAVAVAGGYCALNALAYPTRR